MDEGLLGGRARSEGAPGLASCGLPFASGLECLVSTRYNGMVILLQVDCRGKCGKEKGQRIILGVPASLTLPRFIPYEKELGTDAFT